MTFLVELRLVQLEAHPLTVERTLGGNDVIASRVSTGVATPYRVTEDAVSDQPELVAELRRRDGHDYYAVGFVCSFLERDRERIESATLSVQLETETGDQAIAWSLWPQRLASKPVRTSSSRGLSVGLSLGVDLSLTGERSFEHEEEQWYIVAAGERESDPEWSLRRTQTTTLDGRHDMALVAQVPRGGGATVMYGLTAVVERPRFGVAYAKLNAPPTSRRVTLAH